MIVQITCIDQDGVCPRLADPEVRDMIESLHAEYRRYCLDDVSGDPDTVLGRRPA